MVLPMDSLMVDCSLVLVVVVRSGPVEVEIPDRSVFRRDRKPTPLPLPQKPRSELTLLHEIDDPSLMFGSGLLKLVVELILPDSKISMLDWSLRLLLHAAQSGQSADPPNFESLSCDSVRPLFVADWSTWLSDSATRAPSLPLSAASPVDSPCRSRVEQADPPDIAQSPEATM